ncbi:MAG: hypothetical protein ACXIUO_00415 [Erythrobacter sp.]
MMSELEPVKTSPKWRKAAIQTAIGFVVGVLAMSAAIALGESLLSREALAELPFSVVIAVLTSLTYLFVSLAGLCGALSPRVGARILNVEDADEARELQAMLRESAIGMALWAAALLALALAQPAGPVAAPTALALGAGGLIAGVWYCWRACRVSDELWRMITLETAAVSFGLVALGLGGWAMLAHLGFAPAPQPLDLLTACLALMLVATFIVGGRRGMLTPR